jgi:predicted permease
MFVLIYSLILRVDPTVGRQCVILAGLPSAVASYLLASNAGVGAGVASTMICWSNVFFVPSVIMWSEIMDALGVLAEK